MINTKEEIAKLIVSKMSDLQKKQMLEDFYNKNKGNPDIKNLMNRMREMLGYEGTP